jgi:hypothetical protein
MGDFSASSQSYSYVPCYLSVSFLLAAFVAESRVLVFTLVPSPYCASLASLLAGLFAVMELLPLTVPP